jgi:hypothetical protein
MGDRPYNKTVQIYTQNTYIPVAKGCFSFQFTNIGDTTANVDGMVVFPSPTPNAALGDSRTIGAHQNEVYTGIINLSFAVVGSPFPVGTTPAVEVVQLFYADSDI